MATSFKGDKAKCYICGEFVHKDEQAFILQKAKVKRENIDNTIDLWKNGSARFVAHASCQNKILWQQFNPHVTMDEEYYAYITLGHRNKKRIWKLGNRIIKDNCTQEELNNLIAMFAKDLLNGKIKGY